MAWSMEVGSFFVMPNASRSGAESLDGLPGCHVSHGDTLSGT